MVLSDLDYKEALLALGIELRRLADFSFLDERVDFQEAAKGIFNGELALGMRLNSLDEVGGVRSCYLDIIGSQTRRPWQNRSKRTQMNNTSFEPTPINFVTVDSDQRPILSVGSVAIEILGA